MRKIILLSFILTGIIACSKKSGNPGQDQSNTDLIINKKWKISAISGKLADGTVIPDDYTGLPSYKKDDYWYFKADLTFTYNDNVDKRPGSTNDIMDFGTWSLTNGDAYLSLISTAPQAPGYSITYFPTKVLLITSANLKLESTDTSTGDIILTSYITIP